MKILRIFLFLTCLAGTAAATDLAMDIKLNGREIATDEKSSPIMLNGILIINDIDSKTNELSGSFILVDVKKSGWEYSAQPIFYWPWGWFWMKYVHYYEYEDPVDVNVHLILNKNNEFGMIVDMDGAAFSGIGHLVMNKNGVKQAVISAGHGAFMYAGTYEDPVVTNTLTIAATPAPEGPVMELEVGKMSALLNKKLTDAINDSDDDFSIDEWLENHNYKRSGKYDD